ncbi:hypothetical protein BOQ62_09430 [Chryseobacterium sp. CH21]|uniref:hypothetical protein n=1 Tax=Chryseobacterium sp. CH21 TaxID=713556 RepID=UPI00100B8CD2|nr:hypothetical protein [Chryseobacterium sp. CH21]RXM39765.1 hypothetical protein BOQ62_09430 [Chryseobacterium sp. CH21]
MTNWLKEQSKVYHDGIVRLQLMREDIPISKRLRGGFMVKVYIIGLKYILNKNVSIRAHYDRGMRWGAGISLAY